MDVGSDSFFVPDWPTPNGVHSLITTRLGGFSSGAYSSNNFGDHVGDDANAVRSNREHLARMLPADPHWLKQVHSVEVVDIGSVQAVPNTTISADGAYTRKPNRVCVVMTADCLPLLICSEDGAEVAAVHAGWRGLAGGIVASAIAKFTNAPAALRVFLGPAISAQYFEVGEDVLVAFERAAAARHFDFSAQAAFTRQPSHQGQAKYLANIYELARLELRALGVEQIFGGDRCTYSEEGQFYSYRREGETGRMASLIWLD
ncbi:peptidoglycan editing factor PgeF [Teredinibacter haidensis]|uniref:peptidoglycan editing factor PgeF n=1 Tax=Teredinibacter haidensis TaxID=2731755 RepID=UPI000948C680|nr:peptidoglycan editing factor PgeF [Teredinibacter haidensis]